MFPFSFLPGHPLLPGLRGSLTDPHTPGLPAGLPRGRVPARETSGPFSWERGSWWSGWGGPLEGKHHPQSGWLLFPSLLTTHLSSAPDCAPRMKQRPDPSSTSFSNSHLSLLRAHLDPRSPVLRLCCTKASAAHCPSSLFLPWTPSLGGGGGASRPALEDTVSYSSSTL